MRPLIILPYTNSHGAKPVLQFGIRRSAWKAIGRTSGNCRPSALAFVNMLPIVPCIRSRSPLHSGWYGVVVILSMLKILHTLLNKSLTNCGPQSVRTHLGMSVRVQICTIALATCFPLTPLNEIASCHLVARCR